jgi:hypothetical protein
MAIPILEKTVTFKSFEASHYKGEIYTISAYFYKNLFSENDRRICWGDYVRYLVNFDD